MPKGALEGWGGARPLVVKLGFILGRVSGPGGVVRQLSSQNSPCGRSASRGWASPGTVPSTVAGLTQTGSLWSCLRLCPWSPLPLSSRSWQPPFTPWLLTEARWLSLRASTQQPVAWCPMLPWREHLTPSLPEAVPSACPGQPDLSPA